MFRSLSSRVNSMTWNVTNSRIEKVVDTNPAIYLERAELALKELRFVDAVRDADTAIKYSSDSNNAKHYKEQKTRIVDAIESYQRDVKYFEMIRKLMPEVRDINARGEIIKAAKRLASSGDIEGLIMIVNHARNTFTANGSIEFCMLAMNTLQKAGRKKELRKLLLECSDEISKIDDMEEVLKVYEYIKDYDNLLVAEIKKQDRIRNRLSKYYYERAMGYRHDGNYIDSFREIEKAIELSDSNDNDFKNGCFLEKLKILVALNEHQQCRDIILRMDRARVCITCNGKNIIPDIVRMYAWACKYNLADIESFLIQRKIEDIVLYLDSGVGMGKSMAFIYRAREIIEIVPFEEIYYGHTSIQITESSILENDIKPHMMGCIAKAYQMQGKYLQGVVRFQEHMYRMVKSESQNNLNMKEFRIAAFTNIIILLDNEEAFWKSAVYSLWLRYEYPEAEILKNKKRTTYCKNRMILSAMLILVLTIVFGLSNNYTLFLLLLLLLYHISTHKS